MMMNQAPIPIMGTIEMNREWEHDLFGCCEDPGHCCLSCCCPCLSIQSTRDIIEPDSGSNWCCLFFCCNSCTCGLVHALQRQAVRQKKGIQGNFCFDCCVGWFCMPCSLTQSYLELKDDMVYVGAPNIMPNMQQQAYPMNAGYQMQPTNQPIMMNNMQMPGQYNSNMQMGQFGPGNNSNMQASGQMPGQYGGNMYATPPQQNYYRP